MKGIYRRATATTYGKIHIAFGNMTLCYQYASKENELIDKPVNCKACIKKAEKQGINLEDVR